MLRVQTMGDARAARSEMKGAVSGEEQAFGAMLGRMAMRARKPLINVVVPVWSQTG